MAVRTLRSDAEAAVMTAKIRNIANMNAQFLLSGAVMVLIFFSPLHAVINAVAVQCVHVSMCSIFGVTVAVQCVHVSKCSIFGVTAAVFLLRS